MLNPKFDLYKREWLDLVFADRNKNYGAYDLRVNYNQYMMRAVAITLAIFGTGILLSKVLHKQASADIIYGKPTVVDLSHKYVKPPEVKKQEEIHVAKVRHIAPARPIVNAPTQKFEVLVPTDKPVEDIKIPPQNQITNPGLTDNKGTSNQPAQVVDHDPGAGTGTGNGTGGGDDQTTYEAGVDVMPEPVGGIAAWSKFLQRNIRYPDTDVEGKVYLSFVVERDGHLSNIVLVRGISTLLDEEALRVLKIAPNWKPGMQNGQPVRVKYTLPINFQLNQ